MHDMRLARHCLAFLCVAAVSRTWAQTDAETFEPTRTIDLAAELAVIWESSVDADQPTLARSTAPVSPLLVLWASIQTEFPTIKTIATRNTKTGEPSYIVFYDGTKNPELPEQVRYIQNAASYHLDSPDPPATRYCTSGTNVDIANCCHESVNVDCMLRVRWEGCDNKICEGFAKGWLGLHTYWLLGKEISSSSFKVTKEQLKAGEIPGNALVYVWPWFVDKTNTTFLVSTFDSDVVARVAATSGALVDRLRQAQSSGRVGLPAYECSGAGFSATNWPVDLSGFATLDVSTGGDVRIARPVPRTAPYFSTVRLASKEQQTFLLFAPDNTTAIGGDNNQLIAYSSQIPVGANWFPCVGQNSAITEAIRTGENILNNPETSVWFFHMLYLKAVHSEFLSGTNFSLSTDDIAPLIESNGSTAISRIVDAIGYTRSRGTLVASRTDGDEMLDCRAECDSNSYRCLPIPYLDDDRLRQLSLLRDTLLSPQPLRITPLELGAIFDMQTDPNLGLRGDTEVVDGRIMNQGSASSVRATEPGGRELLLAFPQTFAGSLVSLEESSLLIELANYEESARVTISDPVLNDGYGGTVRAIFADSDSAIFTTENGCLETDLDEQPSPMTVARRMARAAADAPPADRWSLLRLLFFTGVGDDKEEACLSVAGGYGAGCNTCPPYNFTCETGDGDRCVIVYGVRANDYEWAKTLAENDSRVTGTCY